MRTRRLIGSSVALLCAATLAARASADSDPLAALEAREEQIFERIGPSVVFISTEGGFGSGFFVGADGLILTSAHVVGRSDTVSVVTSDGKKWRGKVVERAAGDIDLALVDIDGSAVPVLELAVKPTLRVGSWVASVGHGRGGIWAFNTGIVSNIYPDGADRPVFQTQIPLNPGSSGGPIVDRHGRVVGIVTAGLRDSNSLNFAIRSEVAFRSLRLLEADACLTIEAPSGTPVFVDGKMVGTGPRVLVMAEPRSYEIFAVIGGVMKKLKVRYPEQHRVTLK